MTSFARYERDGMKLRVTCIATATECLAGGPVEVDLSLTNETAGPVFYPIGNAGARTAYLEFSADVTPPGATLRDPYPGTSVEPFEGPVATIECAPGQTDTRTIVLNQYLALEDTRALIDAGESALLDVRWRCHVTAARRAQDQPPAPQVLEGECQATLTRDDESLRQTIQSLADAVMSDAGVVSADPAARMRAITILSSLRIPEVIPHLRRLAGHVSYEVRRTAQTALRELGHEHEQ